MAGEIEHLMQKYRDYKAAPKIPKPPPPVPNLDEPITPETPTMTSASTIPPIDEDQIDAAWQVRGRQARYGRVAPELGEDIVARPLVLPDFMMDVQRHLANPNLWPRWIFSDRRRYAQACAQGWRNARQSDFKPGFMQLSPYSEEGGTKYVNGDLILMLIDRRIYLGALRHKHQVAANFSDVSIAKRVSAQKAQAAMGAEVNAYNKWMERQGKRPAMEVFDPAEEPENFKGVMADPAVAAKEISRVGNETTRDTGFLSDLAKDKQ